MLSCETTENKQGLFPSSRFWRWPDWLQIRVRGMVCTSGRQPLVNVSRTSRKQTAVSQWLRSRNYLNRSFSKIGRNFRACVEPPAVRNGMDNAKSHKKKSPMEEQRYPTSVVYVLPNAYISRQQGLVRSENLGCWNPRQICQDFQFDCGETNQRFLHSWKMDASERTFTLVKPHTHCCQTSMRPPETIPESVAIKEKSVCSLHAYQHVEFVIKLYRSHAECSTKDVIIEQLTCVD